MFFRTLVGSRLQGLCFAWMMQGCAADQNASQGPSDAQYSITAAVHGEEGLWVRVASANELAFERERDGQISKPAVIKSRDEEGTHNWFVSDFLPTDRFRFLSGEAVGIWHSGTSLEFRHDWGEEVSFWNDDALQITLETPQNGLGAWLGLVSEDGKFEPLDMECLKDSIVQKCRDIGATAIEGDPPPLNLTQSEVFWWGFVMAYGPVDVDGRPLFEDGYLGRDFRSVVSLGGQVLWGDLHGHSGLSPDGCEMVDEVCHSRDVEPALDFFSEAKSIDLDFAAITDHAELNYWQSTEAGEEKISIWESQKASVGAAMQDGFLPLLGYEWTSGAGTSRVDEDGLYLDGHKTVILEDRSSDAMWRISAGIASGKFFEISGEDYSGINLNAASDPSELYSLLDDAADSFGPQEVVVFAHHPGLLIPQGHDWRQPENAVDYRYERLVEIHSEHGSSECIDRSLDGCDFGSSEHRGHFPPGSIQSALLEGFRLGFVGGTDSHDARPGSIHDGGGNMRGPGENVYSHPYDGGLTGVITLSHSQQELFASLKNRRTVVTSGPRIPFRAVLVGDNKEVHFPGAELSAGVYRLLVEIPQSEGIEIEKVELVMPDNSVEVFSNSARLDSTVEAEQDDVFYVRIRFMEDEKPGRMWASPWFFD